MSCTDFRVKFGVGFLVLRERRQEGLLYIETLARIHYLRVLIFCLCELRGGLRMWGGFSVQSDFSVLRGIVWRVRWRHCYIAEETGLEG